MVRQLVGYDRYDSKEALDQLNRLYSLVGRYMNFFQPVMQPKEKHRQGSRVRKVYDTPRTPYRRLLENGTIPQGQQEKLAAEYRQLNPVKLLRDINKELDRLWHLADTPLQSTQK